MSKTIAPASIADDFHAQPVSNQTLEQLEEVAEDVGGPYQAPPGTEGAVGFTHFDAPSSEDNSIVVLLAKESMDKLPSQTLISIKSIEDKKGYLGIVVAGPFAEPDGLRADSSIVVATTVQGKLFLPRYHGRAYVQILGEEIDGKLVPPRFRPRPEQPDFSPFAREDGRSSQTFR